MNDELKAAAERGLQKAIEKYRNMRNYEKPVSAAVILADAYLADLDAKRQREAEHALPITEEWLRSVGGEWDESQFAFGFRYMRIAVWIRVNGQAWLTCDSTYGGRVVLYRAMKTSGDVRRLLEALGVEAKR